MTGETTNLPNIELVSEKVHEAWMITKTEQGFHAPAVCPSENHKSYNKTHWQNQERFDEHFNAKTYKWCDKCHPCLYPYNELSEKDKDLDRSTVAAVYTAIEAASPALGGRSIQSEGPSVSECEGDRPEGQRPDNQVLPQETTTQNIKTPTLQEIKDQVAQQHGCKDWAYMRAVCHYMTIDEMADKAAKEYAHQFATAMVEADRKDCAAQAYSIEEEAYDKTYWVVDQDSILNRPLPKMQ